MYKYTDQDNVLIICIGTEILIDGTEYSPEIYQYIYGDLNFDNGPKAIVKKAVFPKNSAIKIAY